MLAQTRFFSLEEANAILPRLESLLSRLIEKKESHDRQHDYFFMSELLNDAVRSRYPSRNTDSNTLDSGAQSLDEAVMDLETELNQIKAWGCLLRSLDQGWVEFPSQKSGQPIYYCWKKGETTIAFYRPAQSASFQRLPL